MVLEMIPVTWVLQAMNVLEPTSYPYRYEEVATAIAQAAEETPVFEGEGRGFRTASLLVALAWHESRFRSDAVGDHGRSFGLFQIRPDTAGVAPMDLMRPKKSAYVACSLIARSMLLGAGKPLDERLGLYASGQVGRGLETSRDIMRIARKVGM